MRILSRILITVLVLLGVAFVVMLSFSSCQNRVNYAGGKAGCGAIEYKFGVDANGPVFPFHTKSEVVAWLSAKGVGNECYKILFLKDWHVDDQTGGLGAIQCITKKGPQFAGPNMTATSGSGGTQRVMFNSTDTRDAFKKYIGK